MTEVGTKLSTIDRPIYRYWQAIYHSFFNPRLYVDVAKRWKGLGLIYLLLIIFIFSIPFALKFTAEFNQILNEKMIQPIMNLPTFYVQNGQVSLDKPMPYFVKNKKGQVVSIVDTTGVITTIDDKYPEQTILVTKDKLLLRTFKLDIPLLPDTNTAQESKILTYPFDKQSNTVFSGEEWVKTSKINNLKYFVGIMIYLIFALVAFGCFLVFILALALMAQFIAKLFFKISLSYKQSCRLLIVSMTPFMLLFWLMLAFRYISTTYNFFLPLTTFIYFCFAVLAVKRESHKLVRT
ncbi:MAG: DUF1189 family protein [Tatlockia sp.]|nr:DUF1189 family protein [Tatlockia sp.]